jgi:hypothetical protein
MGLSLQPASVDRSLSGFYRGNHDNFGLRCVWRAWALPLELHFGRRSTDVGRVRKLAKSRSCDSFRGAPSLALAKIRPVLFVDGSFLSAGMKAWVKPDHLDVAPRRIRDPVYLRVRARTSLLGLQITIALFVSILKIRAFRPVRGTFPDRPAQTA